MKSVTLCDMPVRVDEQGMVSLTDMWKASGGARKNKPALFMGNKKTKEYAAYLSEIGNPTSYTVHGDGGGTWVHKYLAYDFAAWISPEFKYLIHHTLDKFFSGELLQPQRELHDYVLQVKLSEQLGSFHGKGLNRRRWEKHELEVEGLKLLHKYQHQLNFTPKALLSN